MLESVAELLMDKPLVPGLIDLLDPGRFAVTIGVELKINLQILWERRTKPKARLVRDGGEIVVILSSTASL